MIGWFAVALARPEASLPRSPAAWAVAAVVATGDRSVASAYELRTAPAGRGAWEVRTTRSQGEWGDAERFDSASASARDPWPLTLQHLVASVPAAVTFESGRPVALRDPEAWARDARASIDAADLPPAAAESGEALVDPEGLLADLARTFPGAPPRSGAWRRSERIAGVPAVRVERCEEVGRRQVRCVGAAEAEPDSGARLFEVTTSTVVRWDRRGLRSVESRYSGTLVRSVGGAPEDRPISGLRQVERR